MGTSPLLGVPSQLRFRPVTEEWPQGPLTITGMAIGAVDPLCTPATTPILGGKWIWGADVIITKVTVYNRSDCCQDRLLNTDLEILDADGNVVASQPFEAAKNVYHFTFRSVVGRSVRLNKSVHGVLNVGEVQVFGK